MKYYLFFNKKLPEENPQKTFYKRRIKEWNNILNHRFFSSDIGYFTVEKMWFCAEYCPDRTRVITNLNEKIITHWFTYHTMQIRTDAGEKLIVRKLPFILNGSLNKTMDLE